jgi:KRAB domain-containing zinc finger protein
MHDTKKVICDVCGSTWTGEAKLKTHKITVHGERSFLCHCGGAFKSATALKSHQRMRHSGLVFECYHCPKKFQTIGGIRRHIPRHIQATEAAYKCDFCEKTFRIMVDKRDHERGHKGNMFPCHLCDNVYTYARLLR